MDFFPLYLAVGGFDLANDGKALSFESASEQGKNSTNLVWTCGSYC